MTVKFVPFDTDNLRTLLELKKQRGDLRVATRESHFKEFKESFSMGSLPKYAKTMASFANTKGGYMIFGVKDKPRELVGLTAKGLKQFDDIDQEKLTVGLNELFSPELQWELGMYEVGGKIIGLIYTHESENKPVMTRKQFNADGKPVAEGDILYRYRARSEKIHYPELAKIIDDSRARETRALLNNIDSIIRAGASNAAILDLGKETISGPKGAKLVVDKHLINKISFIKEGSFNENEGAPALRLIGDVETANTIGVPSKKIVHVPLTTEEALRAFLERSPGDSPKAYLGVAATGASSFVPVHFFRKAAGMSFQEMVDFINAQVTRSQSRGYLLQRLERGDDYLEKTPSAESTSKGVRERKVIFDKLLSKGFLAEDISSAENAKQVMHAMRSLSNEAILKHLDFYCEIVLHCFENFYTIDGTVADNLRRAVCRLDFAAYGEVGE